MSCWMFQKIQAIGHFWKQKIKRLFGWKERSEYGSNLRRIYSRVALLISFLILIEACFDIDRSSGQLFIGGVFFYTFSLIMFLWLVVAPPFWTSRNFKLDPGRLFLDIIISATMFVLANSWFYRSYGILNTNDTAYHSTALDSVYFSTVTFSTLGFGDFAPKGGAKFFAASEAIIGNLHLGFLVSTLFLIASQERNSGEQRKSHDDQTK